MSRILDGNEIIENYGLNKDEFESYLLRTLYV